MKDVSLAEKNVIVYLQKGYTNKQIADALFVSEKTIKFHLTNIFRKYDVNSRQELLLNLTGYKKTEGEIVSEFKKEGILPISQVQSTVSQQEKIKFIDQHFAVGKTVEHLHNMMIEVTKESVNPATVNAACNCVARLNETINTAIQAARFLNER